MASNKLFNVHPDVWRLGFVSFLTDVSSEAIFSVFAIFFTVIIGASAALLGLVEGLADFASSSLDYLAGWLSDKLGQRKPFALVGYGFSTLAKFFLLIASSVPTLALFRILERLGKSFRGPPRDAWLASVADESVRGYSFGIHKALDKSGAVLGPLLAYALLSWFGQTQTTFHLLFIIAAIVAAGAVALLLGIKDRPGVPHERENIFKAWTKLDPSVKLFLLPAGIFSLAYFSFGFLLLKAYAVGFAIKDVILLYALFNLAFVLVSAPIGRLGDRIGRRYIVLLGYLTYFFMAVGFIFASQKWEIIVLFVLFGVFYSIDEAQGKAFIADIEPERRASAIGFYNFATGLIYLPASVIAGLLWTAHPAYAFGFAAFLTLAAFVVFFLLRQKIASRNAKTLL